jgi:hypothetical protein
MEEIIMKKYFSLVLVLVMALSLAACGSKKESTPTPKKVEATSLTTDGITIEGDYGKATKVTSKTKDLSEYAALDAYLADKTTGSVVYDITIKDKNGKAVQPDGKVNVTVDTEGIADKNSDYVVYYVDDNGAFEKMEVTKTSAKSVTFKTNHFSIYAIGVYDASKHSDDEFLETSKDVEAEAAKAAENAETEANASEPAENTSGYTYTDLSATMFAQQTVNVRDLPDTSGNKVGSLKTNDEIVVTGQCNETGWYRISYGGGTAYVSNSYVSSEKVAVSQPKNDAAGSSAGNNGGGSTASAPASNSSPQTLSELLAYGAERGWYPMPYCEDYGDYFVVYYFAGTDGNSPATIDGKSNVLAVGDIEFLYGGSGSGPVIIKCTCHDAPLP